MPGTNRGRLIEVESVQWAERRKRFWVGRCDCKICAQILSMLSNYRPLHSSVVGFTWYYSAHAATWIWGITSPTRNEVNVAMHYRLTGSRAAIGPYVETQHGRVLLQDQIPCFSEQGLASAHLGRSKVKIVGSMPFRYDKKVPLRDREFVPHDHGEAILKQDRSIGREAERASRLRVLIGGSNSPEVRVIPVPLHSVAAVAECLKIADLVPTSLVMWSTSKARSSAGTPGDILCELPVANGLQFLHLLCGKTVVSQ